MPEKTNGLVGTVSRRMLGLLKAIDMDLDEMMKDLSEMRTLIRKLHRLRRSIHDRSSSVRMVLSFYKEEPSREEEFKE